MKYVELKKFTDEKGAMPVYLFEGEEVYFHEKGETLLKDLFLQEPTLDYVAYEGSALKGEKLKELVSAISSFPFVSMKRMVKVSEFYPTEKDYELYLKPIFENPPKDGILLIVNTGKGKNLPLAKLPNVTFVDCSRSDEETIKKWIYLTCKKAGVYADGITCGKIASYCVYDMARIAGETEKLLAYCEATSSDRLTDEMVEDLVYADSEYKIYELANALSRRNYSAFMKIVKDLSARGFNETSLLSSLASYFKGLYETAISEGSDKDVAASLGIKEYAAKKNREQAAKFTKRELLELYSAVYTSISEIKCGDKTAQSAFKETVAKLFFGKL